MDRTLHSATKCPTAACAGNVWPPGAPVAQGIEHCPPEAGAQVRILPGAQTKGQVRRGAAALPGAALAIFPTLFQHFQQRLRVWRRDVQTGSDRFKAVVEANDAEREARISRSLPEKCT